MVKDLTLLVMFWSLIIAPCLLAMKTGLHRDETSQN
jgi:hypothetical protein